MSVLGQIIPTSEYGRPVNISVSSLVKSGQGVVTGIIINSHVGGTLKLWDSLTASGTVIFDTMTFQANERNIFMLGARYSLGLFATIGGVANITLIVND